MRKLLVLIVVVTLLLAAAAAAATALLAVSFHRVTVVEGIGGAPIPGAYITVERSSGAPEEVGRTDDNGRLVFWTAPLPLPRIICAQSTFYPPSCVNAISLLPHLIEFAVPASTP